MKYKDLFGKAMLDYYNKHYTTLESNNTVEDLITSTSISEKDYFPLPYLFRSFDEMPFIEQKALLSCRGEILDVGCGAGSHALYLQRKGLTVNAIDISEAAVQIARKRGVLQVEKKELIQVSKSFDTILLLMNGTGIFQEYHQLTKYLQHLKSILNENGQILIDSSDIAYMFDEKDQINQASGYYGELDYYISYKGETEHPMKWLYLDFNTLDGLCNQVGLNCEKLSDGSHFDYLARLS